MKSPIRIILDALENQRQPGKGPRGRFSQRVWVERLQRIIEAEDWRGRPPLNQQWAKDVEEAREVLKHYVG